jgi:hypothetical protein
VSEIASERHNRLAPAIIKQIVRETDFRETEAMVIVESVLLGMLRFFRPDDARAQVIFLETMCEALVERIGR